MRRGLRAVGDARPYGRDKPVLRRGGYQPPAGPDPVQAYHGVQTFPPVVGDGALDVPRGETCVFPLRPGECVKPTWFRRAAEGVGPYGVVGGFPSIPTFVMC